MTMREYRTTAQFEVQDQHGHRHMILERTEIVLTKWKNGSTGAIEGPKHYFCNGSELVADGDDVFTTPDQTIKLQRL